MGQVNINAEVARYLDLKQAADEAKQAFEEQKEKLMQIVKSVGGAHETPDGVKCKYTPESVNERFDWKNYLKNNPQARDGYMVKSVRKESLRVTEPKAEDLDEYGWEN